MSALSVGALAIWSSSLPAGWAGGRVGRWIGHLSPPRLRRPVRPAVRRTLLNSFNIEVGAGLGPLAGKIWRVGLMGASSTYQTLLQFLAALEEALVLSGHSVPSGAGVAAASAALRPQLTNA